MKVMRLLALVAFVLTSACAHDPSPLGGAPDLQILDTTSLPAPSNVGPQGELQSFRIGAFDVLLIDVFGMEGMSREVQVDGAGSIAFPLAGVLQARGLTIDELGQAIEERLRRSHIREPRVSVNLKEILSQNLTVDGEVKRAGQYPVIGTVTLMRAVAAAGGTTEFSKLDDVVVFRSVGEQRYAALYNLGAIRRGAYADPRLYPDDIVVVGDSPGRRRFRDLMSASSLLATPLVALVNQL